METTMLAFLEVTLGAAPAVLALQWGAAPLVPLAPWLALAFAGLLGMVAPALAQEPGEPAPAAGPPADDDSASQEESAPAAEPWAIAPAGAGSTESTPPAPELQTIPVAITEPAAEAEPAGTRFDDIQVTASKRLKAQRDIPGSVGALRGDELEKLRAQGMADYMKLIPGVTLTDFGTGQQVVVIRGIASNTGQPGTQFTAQTTGIFLDDMPFADLYTPLSVPDLNPFDLERVEVLKGPQGTLFGSSALAGAVRYIVQKPNPGIWQTKFATTVMQAEESAGLASTTAGALNVPLFGGAAAMRLVGLYREDPGLYDAVPNGQNMRDEEDIDSLEQLTGRALASWDVSDAFKVNALYFQQKTDRADDGWATSDRRLERNTTPFAGPSHNDFGGANLGASYDFDFARALYSGNVMDKKTRNLSRLEQSLPDQFGNQQATAWYSLIDGRVKGSTHELRLSSPEGAGGWLEWLVGAAYLDYSQYFFQFTPNPGPADEGYYANVPQNAEDVAPADRMTSFLWAVVSSDGVERAVFGEVTARLGEHFEATVGARQFETELVGDTVLTGAQIVALSNPPGQTESRNRMVATADGLNPKFSMRYIHDRNMQVYALVAKGFQFGGFQLNPPIANVEQATEAKGFRFGPYDSSVLWNYELGLRTEWLDRRLRFDLTAFYLDWSDLQLTIRVPLNPVPLPGPQENVDLGVIVNVAAAHSKGAEASLQARVFPGGTFTSSAAWVIAVTDVPFDEDHPDGPVPAGTRLPGTPHFQWSNQFEYERSLPYFTDWNAGFALTHAHLGPAFDDMRAQKQVQGYDTLDARLSLARPATAWMPSIDLGVNNITDVRGVSGYAGNGGTVNAYYFVRPRTTLMTLAWTY
jgi:iron complex outermembrane recepter protein